MIGNDECESLKTTGIHGQSAGKLLSLSDKEKLQRPFRKEVGTKRYRSARHQKKWAGKYDYCVVCGTTEYRHKGHGWCVSCYNAELSRKRTKRRKEDKEYYDKLSVQSRKWKHDNSKRVKAYSAEYYKKNSQIRRRKANEAAHGGNYWAVLERDNFTCQRCGKYPVYLVHHTAETHAKDTQITLCPKCHVTIHKHRKSLERYTIQCHKDARFFDEDMVSSIKKLIES